MKSSASIPASTDTLGSDAYSLSDYLRATSGEKLLAKYGMIIFIVLLLLFNVYNLFQPPPDSNSSMANLAIPALMIYFLFAGIAFWMDAKRTPRSA